MLCRATLDICQNMMLTIYELLPQETLTSAQQHTLQAMLRDAIHIEMMASLSRDDIVKDAFPKDTELNLAWGLLTICWELYRPLATLLENTEAMSKGEYGTLNVAHTDALQSVRQSIDQIKTRIDGVMYDCIYVCMQHETL